MTFWRAQEPGNSASGVPPMPRAIWVLGGVSLLMDISSEMIHSLLPVFMVTVLGTSVLVVGLIDGAAEATALLARMVSGPLSDALGRRKPLTVLGYGLGALAKPLIAFAPSAGFVLLARLLDRLGKGIRGAPRDALIADLAPKELRGSAFGLRQSLDTVGAFVGPLLAMGLMLWWANAFRAVFALAVVPGIAAVALLAFGVQEPAREGTAGPVHPLRRETLRELPRAYWWVVAVGGAFTLARISESFLVLRAVQGGLPVSLAPLVFIGGNLVYSLSAYPFGKMSDRVSHRGLLGVGLIVLLCAYTCLAAGPGLVLVSAGIALWGLHMGITQGLLARMVADAAPRALRGTAYGFFNLVAGLALLAGNGVAGLLWDRRGASATFAVAAALCVLALLALVLQPTTGMASRAFRKRNQ
jgi:MFS family permease